jgi:hypothetical protein
VLDGNLPYASVQLFGGIPRSKWQLQPSAVVIVGSHASKVKRLRGLPNVTNIRALESVVRENARQFFLWDVPFVTTSLLRISEDEVIGGAIETSVVESITDACVAAGITLRAIRPESDERLMVRLQRENRASLPVSRRRAILAATVCAIALIVAAAAPGLIAQRMARRATREMTVLARAAQRAADVARDEQYAVVTLETVAAFERNRRPATLLLAALTDALPEESAVTMLRSDSSGVDLVVVSPRVAGVLGALDRVAGVVAPEIVGPISREVVGSHEMERASIHFTYDATVAAAQGMRVPYAVGRMDSE